MSIINNHKAKSKIEKIAMIIFTACGLTSIIAVFSILIYMLYSGTPALFKQNITSILFSTTWQPTGANPQYGILSIILTSLVGIMMAIIIGVPIGVLTAVNLAEISSKRTRMILKSCVEILAGIPSVIYGLLGILIINPLVFKLEHFIFKNDASHQFTGGSNLLSAVLVLSIMILPTLINITETALNQIPKDLRMSSLALGATKIQTIFKVVLPAAKNGIASAIVLGVGRAIGEAMAIVLVAGNSVNFPLPFNSVRFLTTAIVSEMSYASGLHREVLFTIGLVLFFFILGINLLLTNIIKRGSQNG